MFPTRKSLAATSLQTLSLEWPLLPIRCSFYHHRALHILMFVHGITFHFWRIMIWVFANFHFLMYTFMYIMKWVSYPSSYKLRSGLLLFERAVYCSALLCWVFLVNKYIPSKKILGSFCYVVSMNFFLQSLIGFGWFLLPPIVSSFFIFGLLRCSFCCISSN